MNLLSLLDFSQQQGASDLHVSAGLPPFLRIQGELIRTDLPPYDAATVTEMLTSVMNEVEQQQFLQSKELDFALQLPIGRFRVNVSQQMRGMMAVFRFIPARIKSMTELALPDSLQSLLQLSSGLILVTGASGVGKSTTLAAMIQEINQRQAKHIITIEDPIEFLYESQKSLINQRQLYRDTLDVTAALRAALREDPDVILVGELRDTATIRLALTAAETGHLVLATLHTSSAVRTIYRIIDAFVEEEKHLIRQQLAESLQAIVCQTLVKNVNDKRIAAFEILLANSAVRNLIRDNKIPQITTVMQTGQQTGMCTLDQYLSKLVANRMIPASNVTLF